VAPASPLARLALAARSAFHSPSHGGMSDEEAAVAARWSRRWSHLTRVRHEQAKLRDEMTELYVRLVDLREFIDMNQEVSGWMVCWWWWGVCFWGGDTMIHTTGSR
jgi:hypothetical protein